MSSSIAISEAKTWMLLLKNGAVSGIVQAGLMAPLNVALLLSHSVFPLSGFTQCLAWLSRYHHLSVEFSNQFVRDLPYDSLKSEAIITSIHCISTSILSNFVSHTFPSLHQQFRNNLEFFWRGLADILTNFATRKISSADLFLHPNHLYNNPQNQWSPRLHFFDSISSSFVDIASDCAVAFSIETAFYASKRTSWIQYLTSLWEIIFSATGGMLASSAFEMCWKIWIASFVPFKIRALTHTLVAWIPAQIGGRMFVSQVLPHFWNIPASAGLIDRFEDGVEMENDKIEFYKSKQIEMDDKERN